MSPDDVLEYFSMAYDKMLRVHEKNENGLAKKEKMVYSCLDLHPRSLEEIVMKSGLSIGECMDILIKLEYQGYILQTSYPVSYTHLKGGRRGGKRKSGS